MSKSILIKDTYILNPLSPSKVEVFKSSILIEKGVIAGIGDYDYADIVIDGKGKVTLPAFVNCHTHIPMTLFRGVVEGLETMDWLKVVWRIEENLTSNDIYWGALLGCIEQALTGIGVFIDMYFMEDIVAKAATDVGLNIVVSEGIIDINDPSRGEEKIKQTVKYARELPLKYNGKVKVMFAPHSLYGTHRRTLETIAQLSKEFGLKVHIHVAESLRELDFVRRNYGTTPIRALDKLGLLNERTVCAHSFYVDEGEIDLIGRRKASVAHAPVVIMKHGLKEAPVVEYIEKGVLVGLATDGPGSNNNLDFLEEMKVAALLYSYESKNPQKLTVQTVIWMATKAGYDITGFKGGLVKEGYPATLTILDFRKPHLTPLHNIPSHIVYAAKGEDVDTLIVNGELIVEKGKLRKVDVEKAMDKVNELYRDLLGRSGFKPRLNGAPVEVKCKQTYM